MRRALPVAVGIVAIGVLFLARVGDDSPAPGNAPTPATGIRIGGPPIPAIDDPPDSLTEAEIGGIRFDDVTSSAGLTSPQAEGSVRSTVGMNAGAAVADIDDDGDLDVFLTRLGLPNELFRNDGDGRFTDVTAAAELVVGTDAAQGRAGPSGSTAATFADVDGDGAVDLFVAGRGSVPDALFMNDGAGRFRNEAEARGLSVVPRAGPDVISDVAGAAFGDVNRDGWLDLVIVHRDAAAAGMPDGGTTVGASDQSAGRTCATENARRNDPPPRPDGAPPNRSRLYVNDGTGHFVDSTRPWGLDFSRIVGFTPELVDLDADGWTDLVVTGDSCTSRMFKNRAGQGFDDVTEAAGVGTDENGMGSVVRDVNGDGLPDWFVTSIGYPTADGRCPVRSNFTGCSGNRLYFNQGAMTFRDATDELGVRNGWWGWGAAIADFGNDGRLQFVMTNGFDEGIPSSDPDDPDQVFYERFRADPMRFWIGSDGRFVDAAGQVGMANGDSGRALIVFDYDNDGRLDVLVANSIDPPRLFRNVSPPDRHWLTVRLDDPLNPGNRRGEGAKVAVTPLPGGEPVVDWIHSSGSFQSSRSPEMHVGLDESGDAVSRVEVWWPGATAPQILTEVAVDQVLVVRRPTG